MGNIWKTMDVQDCIEISADSESLSIDSVIDVDDGRELVPSNSDIGMQIASGKKDTELSDVLSISSDDGLSYHSFGGDDELPVDIASPDCVVIDDEIASDQPPDDTGNTCLPTTSRLEYESAANNLPLRISESSVGCINSSDVFIDLEMDCTESPTAVNVKSVTSDYTEHATPTKPVPNLLISDDKRMQIRRCLQKVASSVQLNNGDCNKDSLELHSLKQLSDKTNTDHGEVESCSPNLCNKNVLPCLNDENGLAADCLSMPTAFVADCQSILVADPSGDNVQECDNLQFKNDSNKMCNNLRVSDAKRQQLSSEDADQQEPQFISRPDGANCAKTGYIDSPTTTQVVSVTDAAMVEEPSCAVQSCGSGNQTPITDLQMSTCMKDARGNNEFGSLITLNDWSAVSTSILIDELDDLPEIMAFTGCASSTTNNIASDCRVKSELTLDMLVAEKQLQHSLPENQGQDKEEKSDVIEPSENEAASSRLEGVEPAEQGERKHVASWQIRGYYAASELKDDLKPEYKQVIDRWNFTLADIPGVHPGEKVFIGSRYLQLFDYPQSMTLSSCGYNIISSVIDKKLHSFLPDRLIQFLDVRCMEAAFKSVSCPEAFSKWLFYMLSITHDTVVQSRLHGILKFVIGSGYWLPTVDILSRLLVNYGTTPSQLHLDRIDVDFDALTLLISCDNCGSENAVTHGTEPVNREFSISSLCYLLGLFTDALSTRPANYSPSECLALAVILLQVSLDERLTSGTAHLSIECLLGAVLNAIPSDDWQQWVTNLCQLFPSLTSHHHNMVYLVEVLPLVERGIYLKRVISLVWLQRLLPHLQDMGDTLEVNINKSVKALSSMPVVTEDFYVALSLIKLLDYSIGEDVPVDEKDDFRILKDLLGQRLRKVPCMSPNVNQNLYRAQGEIILAKWSFMYQQLPSETMFSSPMKMRAIKMETVTPAEQPSDISDLSDSEQAVEQ